MSTRSTELFGLVNMLGTAGMTWWVSSTVLGATVIGAVWIKKNEIQNLTKLTQNVLLGLVTAFLMTIFLFDGYCMYASQQIGERLIEACSFDDTLGHCTVEDAKVTRTALTIAFGFGTTSFFIYLIGWIFVWLELKRGR